MNYKFYKDPDNRWYVDLPDWTGAKADLEMVAGADTMLDYLSENTNEVTLSISLDPIDGYDLIKLKELASDIGSGAYYTFTSFRGVDINVEMWLCDVMLYVFNGFPDELWISKN